MSFSRYRGVEIRETPAGRVKVCKDCPNRFPVEFNSRGQMTSRQLCDACRELRTHRQGIDLPGMEGVPRCVDCSGLVGLKWGVITHLEADGRCPDCAEWHQRSQERKAYVGLGYHRLGGMWFRRPELAIKPRRLPWRPAPTVPESAEVLAERAERVCNAYATDAALTALQAVAAAFGHPVKELQTDRRTTQIILLRLAVIGELESRAWGSSAIGALLHCHHTTIIGVLRSAVPPFMTAAVTAAFSALPAGYCGCGAGNCVTCRDFGFRREFHVQRRIPVLCPRCRRFMTWEGRQACANCYGLDDNQRGDVQRRASI